MKIIIVAGARPNFMKIAPIIKEIKAERSEGRGRMTPFGRDEPLRSLDGWRHGLREGETQAKG